MLLDEESLEKLSAGASINDDLPQDEPEQEVEAEKDEEPEVTEKPEAKAEGEPEQEPEDWREKRLAKMTHKQKRAEEKLKEYEAKLAKYQEVESKTSEALPEIPDYPEPELQYDDPEKWKQQLAAREAAIRKHAEAEYRRAAQRDAQTAQQRVADEKRQAELSAIVEKYSNGGVDAGISIDKQAYNEEVLKEAGINGELALELYSDDKGAQLVDFLAENPAELEKIAKMSTFRAGEYISKYVKPKAGLAKSKATKAPDPVARAKGSGNAPKDDYDNILPAGYSIE